MDDEQDDEKITSEYRVWVSSWVSMETITDHLLFDRSPNIGPLISCWELDKFKNCWNKSFRTSRIPTLLFQQFSNLLIFQRDMSGPRLGLSPTIGDRRYITTPFFRLFFHACVISYNTCKATVQPRDRFEHTSRINRVCDNYNLEGFKPPHSPCCRIEICRRSGNCRSDTKACGIVVTRVRWFTRV